MKLNGLGWAVVFLILFVLALDYHTWENGVALSFFNFPVWVFYFMALQLILAVCLLFFASNYWGAKKR